jgi:glycosyltransferase involved in cell wall biosynthesis
MRILILNYEYPPLGGGAGNATQYLLREFAKNKEINFDLVTSSTDEFMVEKFSSNITIHRLNIGKKGSNLHYQKNIELVNYSIRSYLYAKRLIKKNHYHLIHAFFGLPCGYLAMRLGLPYIISLRGSDVPFFNRRFALADKLFSRRLSRRIWSQASAVVANSNDLKKMAQKSYQGQISVIPNGVDTEEFTPAKVKRGCQIELISIGRLTTRKGYQYLIPALRNLSGFELTLIGDGDLLGDLRLLAEKNCVKINFLGKIKHRDINKHLQSADIFILPSLNEGMSNSLLEAIACGLPIITTDTGGATELIKNNGTIVKKESITSIRSALKKYQNNRKLILEQGKNSRIIAKDRSWKSVAKQYLDIYFQKNENQK